MTAQLLLIIDISLVLASASLFRLWNNTDTIHLPKQMRKYLEREHRLAFEYLSRDFSGKHRLQTVWIILTVVTIYMLFETIKMI